MLGVGGPPAYFQVRVMICLTLFALWLFTRLVHAFSAPIGYLFRALCRLPQPRRRGQGWWGCTPAPPARFIPRLVPQPTWVAGGG